MEFLLIDGLLVGLLLVIIILLVVLLFKKPSKANDERLQATEKELLVLQAKTDDMKRSMGDEFARNRHETALRLKEINE
ncbi:MAG: hypothetical protein IKU10_04090, partial [Clostridia bacterium]|nr:hypothetical protein [Clostridia bacterium]